MIGEGCKERRSPVDLQHVIHKHSITPSRSAILQADLMVVLGIFMNTCVSLITDSERSEVNDRLRGAVHVIIGMVVMIIDGNCSKCLERFGVGVVQIHGRFVGIGEDTGSPFGCRLNTVEQLDVWWVLEV